MITRTLGALALRFRVASGTRGHCTCARMPPPKCWTSVFGAFLFSFLLVVFLFLFSSLPLPLLLFVALPLRSLPLLYCPPLSSLLLFSPLPSLSCSLSLLCFSPPLPRAMTRHGQLPKSRGIPFLSKGRSVAALRRGPSKNRITRKATFSAAPLKPVSYTHLTLPTTVSV